MTDLLASGATELPAKIASDCLNSVPLDKDGDLELLKGLRPYVEWQSNLAWLKNPPPNYDNPKVDIIGALEEMTSQVQNGAYTREIDFAIDLWNLTMKSRDNHLVFLPDIAQVFLFQRPVRLLSLSTDGQALPQVYVKGSLTRSHVCQVTTR